MTDTPYTPVGVMARTMNDRYQLKAVTGDRIQPEIVSITPQGACNENFERVIKRLEADLQKNPLDYGKSRTARFKDVAWDLSALFSPSHSGLTDQGSGAPDPSYHLTETAGLRLADMLVQLPMAMMVEYGLDREYLEGLYGDGQNPLRWAKWFGLFNGERRSSGGIVFGHSSTSRARRQIAIFDEKGRNIPVVGEYRMCWVKRTWCKSGKKGPMWIFHSELDLGPMGDGSWFGMSYERTIVSVLDEIKRDEAFAY